MKHIAFIAMFSLFLFACESQDFYEEDNAKQIVIDDEFSPDDEYATEWTEPIPPPPR